VFNSDTDLLFPPRTIPALRDVRGKDWQLLVDRTVAAGANSPDQVAFILMMARIDNCLTCNSDSFRAMNGCTACAKLAIKRYHGNDKDLVKLFDQTKVEIQEYTDPNARPSGK
jgi:hypothetical protein